MIPIVVFLTCLVSTVLAYWFMSRGAVRERRLIDNRLNGALAMPELGLSHAPRLRTDILSEMPRANRLLGRWEIAKRLKAIIQQAGLRLTVMRLIMFSAMSGLAGWLIANFLTDVFLLQTFIGLCTSSFPFIYVWRKRAARLHLFLKQLPEALDLMSRALSSGHAFTESMQMVATEMPEPIASEFAATYEAQKLGLSYKLALRHLTVRVPLLELRLCVTAILIQRETGGNLSEILSRVAVTIRERFKILEDLNTLTTASRASAWVLCGLPILMMGIIMLINPGYLDPLFNDPRGHTLLWIAAGMQISGMLVVRRIMQIKI